MQCCNGTGRALTFGRIKRWRLREFRDKITALFGFLVAFKDGRVFAAEIFLRLDFFFFFSFEFATTKTSVAFSVSVWER